MSSRKAPPRARSAASFPATEFMALVRAMAQGDAVGAVELLQQSPELACVVASTGATRQTASEYYFKAIEHYLVAGDTALHMAAAAHSPRLCRELLRRKADVGAENRHGATALHYAADGGPNFAGFDPRAQQKTIELLLRAGAKPDQLDRRKVSALHRAVRNRCSAAVRALLAAGANPRLKNGSGSTPLHLAVETTGRGGSGSPAAKKEQASIVRLLVDGGARASDRNARGKSVLECAGAELHELLEQA